MAAMVVAASSAVKEAHVEACSVPVRLAAAKEKAALMVGSEVGLEATDQEMAAEARLADCLAEV